MKQGPFFAEEPFWTPDLWRRVEARYPRAAQMLRAWLAGGLTLVDLAARHGVSAEQAREEITRAMAFGKRCARVWTPERQWHELQQEAREQADEAAQGNIGNESDGVPT